MIASRSTADLSPATKAKTDILVRTLARDSDIDLLIYSTYRDLEAQAALYASSRTVPGPWKTNAKPGFSFHNWRVAFDVVPLLAGKCEWDVFDSSHVLMPVWKTVLDAARTLGLECGADWPGKRCDEDHLQYPQGITLAQFQSGQVAP